ncbi:hypothetical protein V6O07_13755, partial [Arthrospira platensis SPKY2]
MYTMKAGADIGGHDEGEASLHRQDLRSVRHLPGHPLPIRWTRRGNQTDAMKLYDRDKKPFDCFIVSVTVVR